MRVSIDCKELEPYVESVIRRFKQISYEEHPEELRSDDESRKYFTELRERAFSDLKALHKNLAKFGVTYQGETVVRKYIYIYICICIYICRPISSTVFALVSYSSGPTIAPFNKFGPKTELSPRPYKTCPVASKKYLASPYPAPLLSDSVDFKTLKTFKENLVSSSS
jgi:hypothetical protein